MLVFYLSDYARIVLPIDSLQVTIDCNVESGECRECLAVARKLGFKTRKEGE